MRVVPIIIIMLTVIGVCLVHIRRQQVSCAHEIERLRSRQVVLRRQLWDQQVRLGYLTAPGRLQDSLDPPLSPADRADAGPAAGPRGGPRGAELAKGGAER